MTSRLVILNASLFLILSKIYLSYCHYFIMTPLDHPYCLGRPKNSIMNKLSVGHRMLAIRIEPNVSALTLTKSNSLCPATLIKPFGNRVRHVTNKDSTWSYWFLSIKILGRFSSCADYLTIGEIGDDYTDNDLKRSQTSGIRLHCRSQIPAVIQTKMRSILIWWHWSRETQPKFVLEISSYIQYRGSWFTPDKIKVCNDSNGFWCSDSGGSDGTCIHGGMRCDGVNNCDSFSLKESSSYQSADEYNCLVYNNLSGIPIAPGKPYYESVWIGNSLYILLGITILILLVSACKICLHNSTLATRLRKSQSVASLQSSSSSSNYDKPEVDEEVYEELPTYSESHLKDTLSQNISIDEVTHEEFLAASNECLEPNCSCEIFQPRLNSPNKTLCNHVIDNEKPMISFSQVHSQSSSQYQSNASIHAPLTAKAKSTTTTTTDSLTGNILAQGQDVIARLNLPGSTRNFRSKLWQKLRTSSYDKINGSITSSAVSPHSHMTGHASDANRSKSHTISRLEMTSQSRAETDEYFDAYVII